MGQGTVGYLDQLQRRAGDIRVDRSDCRDGVAIIQHLVCGQNVDLNVAHCNILLSDKIGTGHHGLDAGQGHGLGHVDRDDFGMGMGAAQDAAGQHARCGHVGAVHGTALDLVHTIGTGRAGADLLELAL